MRKQESKKAKIVYWKMEEVFLEETRGSWLAWPPIFFFFFYFYSLVTLFSSSGLWLKYLCQIDAAIDKKQRLYGVNNLLRLERHTAQVWFEIMIRLKLYNTTFNDMYHFIISIVRLKNSVAQMQDCLVCTDVLLIQ